MASWENEGRTVYTGRAKQRGTEMQNIIDFQREQSMRLGDEIGNQ